MKHVILKSFAVAAMFMSIGSAQAQLAKDNPCKFLGNITTRGSIPSDYATMWNQLTPENETKWGSIANKEVQTVDQALSSWNWGAAEKEYNWCKQNGVQFKFHCLLWTSQYPGYLKDFTGDRLRKQIDIWFEACSRKFPDVTIIDVVNEAIPGHAEGDNGGQAKTFKRNLSQAMSGSTNPSDYKWITEAFKLARKFFPNATLVYNDYNTFQWQKNEFIDLVSTLVKQGAPIDAYGHQSHDLNDMSGSDFKSRLYDIHNQITQKSGRELACYLTEYDIAKQGDNGQKTRYSEQIPIAWEADFVAGITLWGYVHGATWVDDSGLIKNGQDRPAMTWLRQYMASDAAKKATARFCGKAAGGPSLTLASNESTIALGEAVKISATMTDAKHVNFKANGIEIKDKWVSPFEFEWTPEEPGEYKIEAVGYDSKDNKATATMTIKVVEVGPYGGTPAEIPGRIEAENYDNGFSGKAYYDLSNGNTCDDYTNYYRNDDVDIKKIPDGVALGNCQKGEWMNYTVNVKESGTYKATIRVGEGNDDGKLTISLGDMKESITVEKTGAWGSFAEVELPKVTLVEGEHVMKISIDQDWIDIDWIEFEQVFTQDLESAKAEPVAIVPNPAVNTICITGVKSLKSVEILDLTGSVVLESADEKISIEDLNSGVYVVRVTTEAGIYVKKLVVKK
ncbi:MAG: endo-1,4-beta-xylanase [Paludibacteraceae bacterium]|nr:endo-1,4-beta-xylanase [Paludibacteraceae bacterium]